MKRLTILILFLFTISVFVFSQNARKDYVIYKDEAKIDSVYYRILSKDNSSWGFINDREEILIPLGRYKFLNAIDKEGMILATKDGKEGYIDINENIIIPFIYDDIGIFSGIKELAPVIKYDKQGFINRKGEEVIPLQYDASSSLTYFYDPGLAILHKNGKYGVINVNNNVIIPFEYNSIKWSDLNGFFIATKGKELLFLSIEGKVIFTSYNTEVVSNFSSKFKKSNRKHLPILLKQNGDQTILNDVSRDINYMNGSKRVKDSIMLEAKNKFAYLDIKGNFIVPFDRYDIAKPFALGRKAIVAKKGKYGIIDEYGKEVLPLAYDFVENPSENSRDAEIFVATKRKEVIMLDSNVNVIPVKNIVSYADWNGKLIVSDKNNKKGIVDYSGKQVIPFEYDTLIYNSRTSIIATKGNMYGCITADNEIVKPFDYRYIYTLNYGLAFVDQLGKVGLFDNKGKIIIPFEYDAIYNTWYNNPIDNRYKYIVVKDGKVGTIDENNKIVIPIIYDALSGWVEYGPEAHFVRQNGKYGLISHQGEIIIPIEYEYVGNPQEGLIKVCKNGQYGVVTLADKKILPCIYDCLIIDIPFLYVKEQIPKIVVCKDAKWSCFDLNGNLQNENIPEEDIIKEYGEKIISNDYKPSNEHHDFHMKQHPIVEFLNDKNEITIPF